MHRKQSDMVEIWVCLTVLMLLLLTAIPCGCNRGTRPDLGSVRGRVTLNGTPLEGAGIAFRPKGRGRESSGVTDSDGNYSLRYVRDIQGAAVDWHKVRISTGDPRSGKPERVPERYNTQSELRKHVEAGDNVIDFELTSK